MSREHPVNQAASVRAKLRNIALQRQWDFNYVLVQYGIERLLYRLSRSTWASKFVLKGATLFQIWSGEPHRATRDVDLLGYGSQDIEALREAFQAIVAAPVEPDGLDFLPESVRAERIKEGQRYEGVRLHLLAMLGNIRIPVQVDVGFGDAVTPIQGELPVLLNLPAPRLQLYPREVVVAEKLQAIVALGLLNGRLKDFYDLGYLAEHHAFDGLVLAEAIAATFLRRKTAIPSTLPAGLTPAFAEAPDKVKMWSGFLAKAAIEPPHQSLPQVIDALQAFLWPPLDALGRGERFDGEWIPGGPWR